MSTLKWWQDNDRYIQEPWAEIVRSREELEKMERENAELKQRILDDNKAYGCELRDPSGTIWEHAKRLQAENAALRELAARMATEMREVDHEFASLRDYEAARKEAQP